MEAGKKFFILDERGLITKARSNLMELEENFYDLSTFAEDDTSMEGKLKTIIAIWRLKNWFLHEPKVNVIIILFTGMGLLDVVNAVKPNILIGLSTCGGLFSGKSYTHWQLLRLIYCIKV